MAGKRFIKQLLACLLIIVFSQKMGMGLYLHNWLHSSSSHEAALTGDELKNACSCINDFTEPLQQTDGLQILPPPPPTGVPTATVVSALPLIHKFFHSLRAPPVTLI